MSNFDFSAFEELVENNRCCRRFKQEDEFSREELSKLVNLARRTSSGANRQPLKYYLAHEEEMNEKIFSTLSWAGALKEWDGPEEGEKPSGYIVMLGDKDIAENYYCDPGIAAQTILLGARTDGRAGCIFAAIDKEELREKLNLDDRFEILYVLALGTPDEEIELEKMEENDYNYWRDDDDVHHVPKRSLGEIIIN